MRNVTRCLHLCYWDTLVLTCMCVPYTWYRVYSPKLHVCIAKSCDINCATQVKMRYTCSFFSAGMECTPPGCSQCFGPSPAECIGCEMARFKNECIANCPERREPNKEKGNECECIDRFTGEDCTGKRILHYHSCCTRHIGLAIFTKLYQSIKNFGDYVREVSSFELAF